MCREIERLLDILNAPGDRMRVWKSQMCLELHLPGDRQCVKMSGDLCGSKICLKVCPEMQDVSGNLGCVGKMCPEV